MSGVRIDKWLWAARFFKTRSLASRACDLGRIESNGQPAKPSREIRVGDLLQVKNEAATFRWKFSFSAKCAARRRLHRRSTVKPNQSRELRLKFSRRTQDDAALRSLAGGQTLQTRTPSNSDVFAAECSSRPFRSFCETNFEITSPVVRTNSKL